MFDSLDEQIRKDEDRVSSPQARMMKYRCMRWPAPQCSVR